MDEDLKDIVPPYKRFEAVNAISKLERAISDLL
jgi:hypothetical protein